MVGFLNYLLYENIADDSEKLVDRLRKVHGVSAAEISQIYRDAERNVQKFYQLLLQKNKELEAGDINDKAGETPEFTIGGKKPISLDSEIEDEDRDDKLKDESVAEVLKYLVKYFHSRDRVRVLAARFRIDPDIYEAAGLGHLPDNYTDEDVWNTMNRSGKGRKPFNNSIWQPLYIRTFEHIKHKMPEEVRDKIADIVQSKKDITYPIKTYHAPNDPVGHAFEGRLLGDIIVENDGRLSVILEGTPISVIG